MSDEYPGQPPGRPDDDGWPDGAGHPTPGPGVEFNPQSASPYQQPPQAPPAPQQYPAPPPGYVYPPGAYAPPVLPDQPQATPALVLGVVSIVGTFVCLLPIILAPVAWVVGAKSRREIRAAPHRWGGESKATAGMVLGIIGTVLLVLGFLVVVGVLVVLGSAVWEDSGTTTGTSV